MGQIISIFLVLIFGYLNLPLLEEMGNKAWGAWMFFSYFVFNLILSYFGV